VKPRYPAALRPADFWCNTCQSWTPVREYNIELPPTSVDFGCSRCGEDYQCGECGYEIDRMGNCTRPDGHVHVHEFGPFEHSPLGGALVRRCNTAGCSVVSLDGDDS
jgi:hypothetical protein